MQPNFDDSFYQSSPRPQHSMTQIGISAAVPCIPGKNQRVLINKKQTAKSTTTAQRLFKKPLVAGAEQALSSANFSSFLSNSKSHQVPPFNSKDLRFDGKLELKEYFNKEAGPGSYNDSVSTVESSLNQEMRKLKHFDGTDIIKSFNNKQKRFIPTAEMVHTDPNN